MLISGVATKRRSLNFESRVRHDFASGLSNSIPSFTTRVTFERRSHYSKPTDCLKHLPMCKGLDSSRLLHSNASVSTPAKPKTVTPSADLCTRCGLLVIASWLLSFLPMYALLISHCVQSPLFSLLITCCRCAPHCPTIIPIRYIFVTKKKSENMWRECNV